MLKPILTFDQAYELYAERYPNDMLSILKRVYDNDISGIMINDIKPTVVSVYGSIQKDLFSGKKIFTDKYMKLSLIEFVGFYASLTSVTRFSSAVRRLIKNLTPSPLYIDTNFKKRVRSDGVKILTTKIYYIEHFNFEDEYFKIDSQELQIVYDWSNIFDEIPLINDRYENYITSMTPYQITTFIRARNKDMFERLIVNKVISHPTNIRAAYDYFIEKMLSNEPIPYTFFDNCRDDTSFDSLLGSSKVYIKYDNYTGNKSKYHDIIRCTFYICQRGRTRNQLKKLIAKYKNNFLDIIIEKLRNSKNGMFAENPYLINFLECTSVTLTNDMRLEFILEFKGNKPIDEMEENDNS